MLRQDVQRIGIKQQRHRRPLPAQLQLTGKSLASGGMKTQARTDGQRTIGLQRNGLLKTRTAGDIVMDNGFGHRNLNDIVVRTGNVHRQFPHSRTQTSPSGKYRSTGHTPTARYKQCMAERRLVSFRITRTQHTAYSGYIQIKFWHNLQSFC